METIAGKESLPVPCEGCNKYGEILVEGPQRPYFIVCERCGWETCFVTCPKCEIGGPLVKTIRRHPKTWKCPDCKTLSDFPEDFYQKPSYITYRPSARPYTISDLRMWFRTVAILLAVVAATAIVRMLPFWVTGLAITLGLAYWIIQDILNKRKLLQEKEQERLRRLANHDHRS